LKRQFTDEQEAEIADRYAQGSTSPYLAKLYATTALTICRIVRKRGGRIRKPGVAHGYERKVSALAVLNLFAADTTNVQIAELLGVSRERVRQILAKHGVKQVKRPRLRTGSRLPEHVQIQIVDLYRQGGRYALDVAVAVGLPVDTVRRVLKARGVPVKRGGQRPKLIPQGVAALYAMGYSTRQLAQALGVTPSSVERAVKRAGSATRSRGASDARRLPPLTESDVALATASQRG
jgi:DNA-binding CsgD family transcriptional regulator